jgi:hypothetical protein
VIEPTPGRVVWYRPKADEVGPAGFTLDGTQPLAAFIAFVHSSTSVNLGVLAASGEIIGRVSVRLVQDRDAAEGECEWMPFQKGQAGKTDESGPKIAALEQQVAGLTEQLANTTEGLDKKLQALADAGARKDQPAPPAETEKPSPPAPASPPAPVVTEEKQSEVAPQPEPQPQASALDQLAQPQG